MDKTKIFHDDNRGLIKPACGGLRRNRGWRRPMVKLTSRSTFAEVVKAAQEYGLSLIVDRTNVNVVIDNDTYITSNVEHCVELVQTLVEITEDDCRKMEFAEIFRKYGLKMNAASQELEEALGRLLHEKGGDQ